MAGKLGMTADFTAPDVHGGKQALSREQIRRFNIASRCGHRLMKGKAFTVTLPDAAAIPQRLPDKYQKSGPQNTVACWAALLVQVRLTGRWRTKAVAVELGMRQHWAGSTEYCEVM
jgi:hypothetical protein